MNDFKKIKLKFFSYKYIFAKNLIDFTVLVFSFYLAYVVAEKSIMPVQAHREWFLKILILVLFARGAFIFYLGVDRQVWRYVGMNDVEEIFKAVSISSLFVVLVMFLTKIPYVNRIIFLTDWLFCILFLSGVRFLRRYIALKSGKPKKSILPDKRVLLYGTGVDGDIFMRSLQEHLCGGFKPVGWVEDDPVKIGSRIHGIKILGDIKSLENILSENNVDEIIITRTDIKDDIVDRIFDTASAFNVKVKIMPSIYELMSRRAGIKRVRDVEIQDLLAREGEPIDIGAFSEHIKDRRFMVTGGCGSIGVKLASQLAKFNPQKLVIVDMNENAIFWSENELVKLIEKEKLAFYLCDIKNGKRLEKIIEDEKPGIIYHAAAYKHVPISQSNPAEYVLNNVKTTKNIIDMCKSKSFVKKVCIISSDKAVNPVNVMGVTKRLAECLVMREEKSQKFFFVRFGNVLGSRGSVVPIFQEMIEKGGPVKITHPQAERYFMDIHEAVGLVMQTSFMTDNPINAMLDMGKSVKITELAKLLIRLSGIDEENIEIVYSGLRPGEKITEELYAPDTERLENTGNKKIFKLTTFDRSDIEQMSEGWFSRLFSNAEKNDNAAVLDQLKEKFPEIML